MTCTKPFRNTERGKIGTSMFFCDGKQVNPFEPSLSEDEDLPAGEKEFKYPVNGKKELLFGAWVLG